MISPRQPEFFQQSYHFPGLLSANITIRWKAPFDCFFHHISAVASNNTDATLKVGDSGDDDEIITNSLIGTNGNPAEFTVWTATNPTGSVLKGDVIVYTLDYDGVAGTAAQNVTLLFTLRRP